MKFVKKVLGNLDEIVISIALATVCIVLILQVFFRYILNNPLIWSEELARYLFIWLTMLGLSYNIRTDNNISMQLLYAKMSPTVRDVLDILTDLAAIGLFVLLLPSSCAYLKSQTAILSSALKIPLGFLAASIPLSFLLSIIQLFVKLIKKIKTMCRKKEETA